MLLLPEWVIGQKQNSGNDQIANSIQDPFYYFEGQKYPLELNPQVIAVTLQGENSVAAFQSLSKSISNQLSDAVDLHSRTAAVIVDQSAERRQNIKEYYLEIDLQKTTSKLAYAKQIEAIQMMPGVTLASPTFFGENQKSIGMTNNFLVELREKSDLDLLYREASKWSVEVLGHDPFMAKWFTLSVPKHTGLNAMDAANLFYETGLFATAEPELVYHDIYTSNDPRFPLQWSLDNTGQSGGVAGIDMNVEAAWPLSTGANINVAIVDEGILKTHEDLKNNMHPKSYDARSNTIPSKIYGSHGTACAGVVAAEKDNGKGLAGIAPDAKLMAVSVQFGSGISSHLARGINWAVSNGADVISNSWTSSSANGSINSAIRNALDNGRGGKGSVVVFAAGNGNSSVGEYPSRLHDRVMTVGGIDRCGLRAGRVNVISGSCQPWCGGSTSCSPGASYGNPLDVVAGASGNPTTNSSGNTKYTNFAGTSSACPHIAGLAALILSVNPNLTNVQVNDIIEQSAKKIRTDRYTYGNKSGRSNGTWNKFLGYGHPDAEQAVLIAINFGCDQNLTLNGNFSGTKNYKAINNITSTQNLAASSDVDYRAGKLILLKTGFKATTGSKFRAYNAQFCTSTTSTPSVPAPPGGLRTAVVSNISKEYEFIFNDEFLANKVTQEVAGVKLTCYPNPFQYQTTFEYKLEVASSVLLELFDMNGRWIQQLDHGVRNAGTHQLVFQTKDLNPGMYYTKLTSGNSVLTTKILLMK